MDTTDEIERLLKEVNENQKVLIQRTDEYLQLYRSELERVRRVSQNHRNMQKLIFALPLVMIIMYLTWLSI